MIPRDTQSELAAFRALRNALIAANVPGPCADALARERIDTARLVLLQSAPANDAAREATAAHARRLIDPVHATEALRRGAMLRWFAEDIV